MKTTTAAFILSASLGVVALQDELILRMDMTLAKLELVQVDENESRRLSGEINRMPVKIGMEMFLAGGISGMAAMSLIQRKHKNGWYPQNPLLNQENSL